MAGIYSAVPRLSAVVRPGYCSMEDAPHVILSHVLLQEGKDWRAAEQALRAVLALDPEPAEARCNLTLLLESPIRTR